MSDERHAGRELPSDELEEYVFNLLPATMERDQRESIARAVVFSGTVAHFIFEIGREYERVHGKR